MYLWQADLSMASQLFCNLPYSIMGYYCHLIKAPSATAVFAKKVCTYTHYDQFNYFAASHSSLCHSALYCIFDLLHQSQEQQARRASHGEWQSQRDDGTWKQRLSTKVSGLLTGKLQES